MNERKLSRSLMRHTRDVFFTSQSNEADAYWARVFGEPTFVSRAAAKDGKIVAYRNLPLDRPTMAHEMAHNLATAKYGRAEPSTDSDYIRAVQEDGEHPSAYGRKNLAEDFAESVRMMMDSRGELRNASPRRYNVVRRLLRDDTYPG